MNVMTARKDIFRMLDVDGDGVISRAEYLARPERAAVRLGRDTGDPLVAVARSSHERVFSAMDADGDGQVTFEEYAAWAGAQTFDEVCREALGSLFDLADTDADGMLDRAEFARLREVLGNRADNAAEAFDALDTDGDGRVDRDEYLSAIRAFVSDGASPMYEALVTAR
ncbi:EF-hand domain-containing protein [Streptomyces sp. G44]|uniref:EF-hand domain-containing protein n=1 Tax=Streptomyces sp. G44 TaxID=2807632 RepID=UPI00196127BE|nr:EF-hand domain-containing protein [Streptomyces sp. G44]MBM7168667.1 EF-hand domain-containing protein [Streptomyces sp. G44]